MTNTFPSAAPKRAPMTAGRKAALVAGLCYIVTFVTSIPTLALYGPIKNVDYILGSGSNATAQWGAFLEVILALTGIGTAVALYPIVKRQNPAAALGFVTSRVLEASMIFVGVLSLLSIITLRQDSSGKTNADTAALVTTGKSLIAVHDWTFLLGQGLMPGVSALLLGSLLYRSRLVPRVIPLLGLIGAPLLLASDAATIFGIWDQISAAAFLCGLPVALWEISIGIWMTVKGFRPAAITAPEYPVAATDSQLVPA
jgi:hypothetical protein